MGNEWLQPELQNEETYVRPENMSDEVANMVLEAHGGVFTVEEAMRNCLPFRQMAEAILSVPGGEEVFKLSVNKMAESAVMPIEEAKKNSWSSSAGVQLRF